MKRFLLIVEGEKTEKDIFKKIFQKYGCNVVVEDKIKFPEDDVYEKPFERLDFANEKINIVIIQGPSNRIRDLLKIYNKQCASLEKWLLKAYEVFAGIFWVYDVDHTPNDVLSTMFNNLKDETTGLLLVSSPCIEVLADLDRKAPLICGHLSEYKKILNTICDCDYHKNTQDYIIDNFEKIILFYLEKNYSESQNLNIMEHPKFVIDKINELNIRKYKSSKITPVFYRYFTTVIYCSFAYIFGLTKEIDNYEVVKKFFKDRAQ